MSLIPWELDVSGFKGQHNGGEYRGDAYHYLPLKCSSGRKAIHRHVRLCPVGPPATAALSGAVHPRESGPCYISGEPGDTCAIPLSQHGPVCLASVALQEDTAWMWQMGIETGIEQYVPSQELIDRPKTSIGDPIDSWLRGPPRG